MQLATSLTALITPAGASASVKGLRSGITYITIRSLARSGAYSKTAPAIVEDAAQEGVSISVDKKIITLDPGSTQGATVKAALSGGAPLDAENFIRRADGCKIISMSSAANTANIIPTGASGVTCLRVKHPKAEYTVDIAVKVSAYQNFAFAQDLYTICSSSSQHGRNTFYSTVQTPYTARRKHLAQCAANTLRSAPQTPSQHRVKHLHSIV